MWAGYDQTNKSIEAGRYRFWPIRKTMVRKMGANDLPSSLSLLGEALGRRYKTREGLEPFVRQSDGLCSYVAEDGGQIVGAATGEIVTDGSLDASLPANTSSRVLASMPGFEFNCVGILRSIAVSESSKGRGIATALSSAVVDELWNNGATWIISIGWTDTDGCHIKGVLEGIGFSRVATLPGFWTSDSEEKGYECPTCGVSCKCQAELFLLRRSEVQS